MPAQVPPPSPPDPLAPAAEGRSRGRRPRRRLSEARAEEGNEPQTRAAVLVAVAVVGSVLAIGTVHLPVLLVVAAVSFAAAAVALRRAALGRDGLVIPLPALAAAGLAAYTLLQAVP